MKYTYFGIFLVFMMMFGIASQAGAYSQVAQNRLFEARPTSGEDMRSRIEAQRAEMEARREVIQKEAESRREAVRKEIESRRFEAESSRQEMSEQGLLRKTENQEKRIEKLQNIAERRVENATRVITATVERLEKIALRIESRVEKIKARGGEVSESESYLILARLDLKNAMTSISTYASIDLSGETAQDNFQRVRTAVAETREHIRSAHQNLSLAVRSLARVQSQIEVDDEVEDENENEEESEE